MKLTPEPITEAYTQHWVPSAEIGQLLIHTFGYRRTAWRWREGMFMLGHGHWSGVTPDAWATDEIAADLLNEDVEAAARWVKARLTVPVRAENFDALCYAGHMARAGVLDLKDGFACLNERGPEQGAALIHAEILGRDFRDGERQAWGSCFQQLWRADWLRHDLDTTD